MSMPEFDCLKYRPKGTRKKWKYGDMNKFHEEAEKYWEEEKSILVDDAVKPQIFIISLDEYEVKGIKTSYKPKDEYTIFVEKELEKAIKKSDSIKEGLKGKLFKVNCADGYAFYVITKETEKNVYVEYRAFDPDNYIDPILSTGGLFPKERIAKLVKYQDKLNAMFS